MKGKGHGEKRSRKEDMAILAIITEPTLAEAAEKANISQSTLWRWMQKDDFKEKLQRAKRDTVSHVTARLRHAMTVAVDTLEEIAGDVEAGDMARVVAAKTILEYGMKAHENEDLQVRVEMLEDSLRDGTG